MNAACKRLFNRWLELHHEFLGRATKKKKPTQEEADFIVNAEQQASEEELMDMLDWAFHGTDFYALLLQGKRAGKDGKLQVHLGIHTLFKPTKLSTRIELGDKWAHRDDPTEQSKDDKWFTEEALPVLKAALADPENMDKSYAWWAERKGRAEGGPNSDVAFINALLEARKRG